MDNPEVNIVPPPPIFEPVVSLDYLQSGNQKLLEINPEIFADGASHDMFPQPLEGSGYHLKIVSRARATFHDIRLAIVDEDGAEIIEEGSHIDLSFPGWGTNNLGIVSGIYMNFSAEATGKTAIRNLSGVVGPYEDAICQLAANQSGKIIDRRETTDYRPTSRFVQNFVSRGFELEEFEESVALMKTYSPNVIF